MPKTFQYVFIPADSSTQVEVKRGDMSGGLTNDALVQSAKNYFFSKSGASMKAEAWKQATPDQRRAIANEWRKHNKDASDKMTDDQIANLIQSTQASPSCEIMALTIPTKGNMYHAVSMYVSDDHSSSEMKKNDRASQLLLDCGHRLPETATRKEAGVYGDVFVGRCYDNELDEDEGWKRLDFTSDDLRSNSDWIKIAKQANGGGGSGSSNVASLSGMLKQQQGVNAEQNSNDDDEESLGYKWNQTNEEVEMYFSVAADVTSRKVKIKFQRSHLSVKVNDEILVEGEMGGAVIIDECTYTLQDDTNNQRELFILLTKSEEGRVWAQAVR